MKIRPSNLTRSLVNLQAYSQAYINRPFQTLSTTFGPTLLQRQARSQDLPHLPETLQRAAQATGAGLGLFTPFSHAVNAPTSVLRWKPLCPSQQPFYAQTFSSSLRVRLPQASHAPPDDIVVNGVVIALQRFTAPPNAHLHGGTGVRYKQTYWLV